MNFDVVGGAWVEMFLYCSIIERHGYKESLLLLGVAGTAWHDRQMQMNLKMLYLGG